MRHNLRLNIAGITIAISSDSTLPIAPDGATGKFVCDGARADVQVRVGWGDPIEPRTSDLWFDSGKGLWRLYRADFGWRFVFNSPPLGPLPYQTARFNQDFTEGEIEVRPRVFANRLPLYPLHYPLDELLMVHLLSQGRGVEIHGSGIVTPDGVGVLFVGQSGAGKTTMAKLWLSHPGVRILSDERVILRLEGDTIWMHGTPWHGVGRLANPGRGPLKRVFFLGHGTNNEIAALSRTESIARLFSCGFTPFHDARGLEYTLGFLEQVVMRCRCEALRFLPDRTAVAFVLNH
jgi:hypothetical protein